MAAQRHGRCEPLAGPERLAQPAETRTDVSVERAIVRLLRARLGSEPVDAAIGHARRVVLEHMASPQPQPLLPLLVTELGYAQTWIGDLAEAEVNLTTAAALSRPRGFPMLRAAALSHLAMTLHMQGREQGGAEVADEALEQLAELAWHPDFIRARSELVRDLARPRRAWPPEGTDRAGPGTAASAARGRPPRTLLGQDPRGPGGAGLRLGHRRRAGAAAPALHGAAPGAPARHPADGAGVPRQPRRRRACPAPARARRREALGAGGEAALLAGLRHEIGGDRKAAVAAFVEAEEDAVRRPAGDPRVRADLPRAAARRPR